MKAGRYVAAETGGCHDCGRTIEDGEELEVTDGGAHVCPDCHAASILEAAQREAELTALAVRLEQSLPFSRAALVFEPATGVTVRVTGL